MSSPTPPAPTGDNRSLNRSLKSRHLTMISIGGAIGTGLFVASGATISSAGPGGALLAYGLIGFMVWLIMQSLGEMAAFLPVSGSFGEYGRRFMSPSFGFAMGWNYWFNWAITVAAELVAAALVMKYWFRPLDPVVRTLPPHPLRHQRPLDEGLRRIRILVRNNQGPRSHRLLDPRPRNDPRDHRRSSGSSELDRR